MSSIEQSRNNQDSQELPPAPKPISRRTLLKMGATAGAALLAGKLGLDMYVDSEGEKRSNRLTKVCNYLSGTSSERKRFMGRELTYKEFLRVVGELINPPARQEELKAVLDSFTYMLKVEDSFGDPYNTLPALEDLQDFRERHVQSALDRVGINRRTLAFASSYGFGQIQPRTAAEVVTAKADVLRQHGILTNEQITELQQRTINDHRIVEILDLRGEGNLLISFLLFYDCINLYSRSTGGVVHGGLHLPDQRGTLQPIRAINPRGFTLAVAAYSAGVRAPMVAKAQTYINELLMTNPVLREKNPSLRSLAIDGDAGRGTMDAMRQIGRFYGFDGDVRNNLVSIDDWLSHTRSIWQESMDHFLASGESHKPEMIRLLVQDRYSLQIENYMLLRRYAKPGQKTIPRNLLYSFVDNRDPSFLDSISNPEHFMALTGRDSEGYKRYIQRFTREIQGRLKFDEQYKGYIPTFFRAPQKPFADPVNVAGRIILAFDLDNKSSSRIEK